MTPRHILLAALFIAASLTACGTAPGDTTDSTDPQPVADPPLGQSDFVSADGQNGATTQERGETADAAPEEDAGAEDSDERSVEEGDIYRVLDNSRILNLNAFRGLQIIDFSDPQNPTVEGRLQVTGHPVELYVVDDRAFVLLNNWQGYWRSQHDTRPESYQGGLLVTVDISDRTRPRITGKARIPGWIQSSRLTRGGGQQSIYAVTSYWGEMTNSEGKVESGTYTYVKSFSITENGGIEPASEINLGGYVGAIQATPNRLTVARVDWRGNEPRSRVSIIDISNPDGTMVEGDQVEVRGYIRNKHNMNVHGDVLRIVSGSTWSGTPTNHVQTYDASDIDNLEEIDHETFGDNENLFATLFMQNKAFFVTYRQVDPFHAYEITDEGQIIAKAEYIISGWNNFFRPVFGGDRIVGIGINDEEGRNLAVSLYDTTDLSNPDPFVARSEVQSTDWSWSEANWDDRAFSVIEDAVDLEGPNQERETGLVLLPFSGWDRDANRYFAAVQVFTFSPTSLTQRGLMNHGTPVRRSFSANDNLTANLSEAELSLFDTSDPTAPVELGRVELAPNYSDFLIFGDHGVRVTSRDYYSAYWGGGMLPSDKLEIIGLNEDPDFALPSATIEVPAGATLRKVGSLLVAISTQGIHETDTPEYETQILVFDLSQPGSPELRGEVTTRALRPNQGWYGTDDCFDCWHHQSLVPTTHTAGQSLVFTQSNAERLLLGEEEVCTAWPRNRTENECWDHEEGQPQPCTYLTGYRTCRTLEGEEEVCSGSFYRCHQDDEGQTECEEVPVESVRTDGHCYENQRYRHWQHYSLDVLDLSDPANPSLGQTLEMPRHEEGVTILTQGDDLYVNYKIPAEVRNDNRPFVRYYFKKIDLTNPSAPTISEAVNIPGQLLAVYDGGDVAITKDFVWGNEIVEAAINRLTIRNGRAFLDARRRFEDQQVHQVALDERGNLLVSHRVAWRVHRLNNSDETRQELTILDVNSDTLPIRSQTEVDIWAQLREVKAGRALFSVPGGILVFNLDDSRVPVAQAYFPMRGWSQKISVSEDNFYIAAGRFGLHRAGIDESNLELF